MIFEDDMRGFWDPKQPWGGEVTGTGPNFEKALKKYKRRLIEEAKVGTWRCAPAAWKKNNGSYIDLDWDIVEY